MSTTTILRHTVILFLLAFCGSLNAESPLPKTGAEAAFSAWLEAFNSRDLEKIKKFNASFGLTDPAEETLDWSKQTGGYELVKIEESKTHGLIALVRDKKDTDEQLRVTLSLPKKSPSALKLEFDSIDIPRRSQADALAAPSNRIDKLAEEGEFSGAVLIAKNDKVLLEKAWGMADREAGMPNKSETRFRLGSANKMFTAVAILQLVQSGKVSLNATIDQYLPSFPNASVRSSVTVRDLLTHQSGLVDIDFSDSEGFTPETYAILREKLKTHADYVAYYGPRAPLSKPREKIEYNSFAFIVLGAIVESVSGKSYYDYVDANIFKPANMMASGSLPESEKVEDRSKGYTSRDDKSVSNHDTLPYRGTAAGGGYSTVGDLYKFAQALQSGKLLSPELLAQATQSQISENWYGYGFITVGKGPLRRFGHGGDSPGMNADVRIFPESGYVLVSLSNIDPPAAYTVFRYYEPRMPID
ncbi:MAG: serine hydrolase domain-containing protein [Arenimonas sp.]